MPIVWVAAAIEHEKKKTDKSFDGRRTHATSHQAAAVHRRRVLWHRHLLPCATFAKNKNPHIMCTMPMMRYHISSSVVRPLYYAAAVLVLWP